MHVDGDHRVQYRWVGAVCVAVCKCMVRRKMLRLVLNHELVMEPLGLIGILRMWAWNVWWWRWSRLVIHQLVPSLKTIFAVWRNTLKSLVGSLHLRGKQMRFTVSRLWCAGVPLGLTEHVFSISVYSFSASLPFTDVQTQICWEAKNYYRRSVVSGPNRERRNLSKAIE